MKFYLGATSRRRWRWKPHSKSKAKPKSVERNWLELPRDVVCNIFLKLGAVKILTRVQEVCTLWREISKDPFLWNTIKMRNGDDRSYEHVYQSLCRRAVDYSAGNLVEITVEQFADHELLCHIANNAGHLRRLRFLGCWDLCDDGFHEVADKFSQLEEIDISIGSLSEEIFEDIGQCCPRLKSLKFNQEWCRHFHFEFDEGAFAIAKTMPGLCHLQLHGSRMTNAGLLAILDGCPCLVSLDLRRCLNLDLKGSLGRRCAKQIKDLRLPNDSTHDIVYFADDYPSGISDICSLLSDDSDDYDDDSDFYDYDEDDSDYYGDDLYAYGYCYDDYDDSDDYDDFFSSQINLARRMMQRGLGMAPPRMGQQPRQQYQQLPRTVMLPQHRVSSSNLAAQPPPQPSNTNEVRTLWIGNLQNWMDKNYLYTCFAHTGEVTSVVIRNKQTSQSKGYGFIEFNSRAAAERILQIYNGAIMPNSKQSFKLNWATFDAWERARHDDSPDYSIFVGSLAAGVTDYLLQETFRTRYNSVKGANVVMDRLTGRSKGYGFVRFADESEQMRAMAEMHGVLCSTKPMRIGPAATNKNPATTQSQPEASYKNSQRSRNKIDPNNAIIFVGNLDPRVTVDHLRQIFSQYGDLVQVKIPAGKQYGFVQFAGRSCAEEAIQTLNGSLLGGQNVRLSWGRFI